MLRLSAALLLALALGACAHHSIQVFQAPPAAGYRTLGMVSGNGDNESAAMAQVLDQASRLEADAVVVTSTRPVGSQVIITARVIRWIGPPPGATPAPESTPPESTPPPSGY
jgi:hypothetical protein